MNEPFEQKDPISPAEAEEQTTPLMPAEPPVEDVVAEDAPVADTPVVEEAPACEPAVSAAPKKSSCSGKRLIAVALICSLLGGIIGAGATLLGSQYLTPDTSVEPPADTSITLEGVRGNTVIDTTQIDTSKLMTAAEVYALNVSATVGITATAVTSSNWGQQGTATSSGSGFILTSDGYIMTNFHVVDGADTISVATYDGKSHTATLVGYDESNDVAVLKVEAEDLTAVVLGNSDNLNVGDGVVAIGNPYGLAFSLTAGSISAKNRDVAVSTTSTMRLLQTDCAINSGNSGGALFNLYGEVIGITNAKYSSSSGATIDNIGFAIPINKAWSIAESIIEKGYYAKPYIGVGVSDVSEESLAYGLPNGAAVKSITKASPAETAGLKVNDIITHVNGNAISGSSELVELVGNASIGDVLKLTVYRQGEILELTLTVGEQISGQK